MLVALGQVDSIQIAQRPLLPRPRAANENGGKPATSRPIQASRQRPLVAGDLFPPVGLRHSPAAQRRQRVGDGPNPVGYNRIYVHVDGEFS